MAGTPPSLPYSWHAPEALKPPGASSGAILSAEQIERWRTTGALVLDGLLPAKLVADIKAVHAAGGEQALRTSIGELEAMPTALHVAVCRDTRNPPTAVHVAVRRGT